MATSASLCVAIDEIIRESLAATYGIPAEAPRSGKQFYIAVLQGPLERALCSHVCEGPAEML